MEEKGNYFRIRFNTHFQETPGGEWKWRVLDRSGNEVLAKSLRIQSEVFTTEDLIAPNILKYHIACYGFLDLKDGVGTITPTETEA